MCDRPATLVIGESGRIGGHTKPTSTVTVIGPRVVEVAVLVASAVLDESVALVMDETPDATCALASDATAAKSRILCIMFVVMSYTVVGNGYQPGRRKAARVARDS